MTDVKKFIVEEDKTAFNTLKMLTQRQQTKTNLIENAKGKLLTEDIAIYKLWTEYGTELYNYKLNKKSPQIVGLGPLMCSQLFWPVNFDANQLNSLVHLPLL